MSSFSVELYTMAKKHNSTKQPGSVNTPIKTMCTLRGPCGVVNPVLEFQGYNVDGKTLDRRNYCYIPNFARYYYITEWVYDGPLVVAHCKCDVLASFKSVIGNSTQYVTRSQSKSNANIIDNLFPATTDIVRYCYERKAPTHFTDKLYNGTFALTIVSDMAETLNYDSFGATTTLLLDSKGIDKVIFNLFRDVAYMSIDELSDAMTKALVNPLQYVKSLKYYPLNFSVLKEQAIGYDVSTKQLKIGHWNVGCIDNCRMLSSYNHLLDAWFSAFPLQLHPQTNTRGEFLNSPAYSKHTLTLPYYGDYSIPSHYVNEFYGFGVSLHIDLFTGDAYYDVSLIKDDTETSDEEHLTFITVNIGTELVIAQQTQDTLNWATSVGQGVFGMLGAGLRGDIGGIVNAFANGIESATRAQYPTVSSIGTNGSALESRKPIVYSSEHFRIADSCDSKYGRPLCEYVTINNLSGYILCNNASVESGNVLEQEYNEIINHMNSGFYYE